MHYRSHCTLTQCAEGSERYATTPNKRIKNLGGPREISEDVICPLVWNDVDIDEPRRLREKCLKNPKNAKKIKKYCLKLCPTRCGTPMSRRPKDPECIADCIGRDPKCIDECGYEPTCAAKCNPDPACVNACAPDPECVSACGDDSQCVSKCSPDQTCVDACQPDPECASKCGPNASCIQKCPVDPAKNILL